MSKVEIVHIPSFQLMIYLLVLNGYFFCPERKLTGKRAMEKHNVNDFNQVINEQVETYAGANDSQAWQQLWLTLIPYLLLLILDIYFFQNGYIITSVMLSVVNAFFVLRLFVLMHDCCHLSFFKNRGVNRLTGMFLSLFTFCCYDYWRVRHNIHHATHANLDKRGIGDIHFLTVKEYRQCSMWRKCCYRLYRNPFVLLFLGVIYEFLIQMRFYKNDITVASKLKKQLKRHIHITSALLLLAHGLLMMTLGFKTYFFAIFLSFYIASIYGMVLFYLQHNYEEVTFYPSNNWDKCNAAFRASSYFKMPQLLTWLCGFINYHHIHHLSVKVPSYKLKACHEKIKMIKGVNIHRIYFKDLLSSFRLKLYDEKTNQLVSFKSLKSISHG